jgi:hypothetical protein
MHTGQTPGDPALITVTSPDGAARDLTDYTVNGVLYAPDGTDVSTGSYTQISDAEEGLVQFDWPVPSAFDVPGVYLLTLELTTADPDILDITTSVEVEVIVAPPPSVLTLRATTETVSAVTGRSVSSLDISAAQSVITLFTARNLSDDDVWDSFTDESQYWISLAICHQAVFVRDSGNDDITLRVPAGAASVSAGDVSVTMASATSDEGTLLSPLARMALSRVSWMTHRTIHATPFLGNPHRTPMRPLWEQLSR